MCCGQKRRELKAVADAGADPADAALNLRYSGQPQMHVRGSVTGTVYPFSRVRPVLPVDPEDAKALLANPLFRLSR